MKQLLSSSAYFVVNKKLAKRVGLKAAVLLADLIGKEQYFIDNGMLENGWSKQAPRGMIKVAMARLAAKGGLGKDL